jgi:hypothetical protein
MYLIYDYNSMFPIGEWASNLTLAGSVFGDLRTPENIDYIAITSYFPDVTVNGTDPSTGYVTTNSTWVCQVPALYTFKIKGSIYIDWDFVPGLIFNPAKVTTFYFVVAQWDSTLAGKKTVKKTTVEFNFDPSSPVAYRNFEITFGSFNADAGDIFQVQFHQTNEFTTQTSRIYLSDDTSWSIAGNSLEGEGGTILTAEKGASFMLKNELKANVPADIWKTIKANPYKLLNYQVTDDGEARAMNLYDFSRNIISGVTEGETRGRLAAPQQPDVDPGNPVTPEPEEEPE